ncbi:F5/8 type C domain-containing protein [Chitinophaga skermanii]|uniref:F5/8 type C domain-containing protein n=1 Tax=Chitinophaga skermanii TaxID=331697 RepID=A0A327QXZ6_9BACT|nr:DUF1735 domain-containing protein [Chitinophaga skermanii]RAJ08263.1 F5/8 type C domain-containing protein [Chitinophaga skermanii]
MKLTYISRVLLATITLGWTTSCEKINIPKEDQVASSSQVYMAAAARNMNMPVLRMADTTYTITYGASYGGFEQLSHDINVEFINDTAKVTAYNTQYGTSYPQLPAACYSLESLSAVIPKGGVSTAPLAIKVNPNKGMVLFKDYLLAVSIKQVSNNVKLNTALQTAYYIVRASLNFSDFTDYNRANWTIAGVSSEEPAEGEENGGLGKHTIDGKTSTFWHTKWDGGFGTPPHWISVDMGEKKVIHGLVFTGRQSTNNGKPNNVLLEVSDNNITWTSAGTFTLQNINTAQRFFVTSFPEGRYFKVTVLSNFGNVEYTHLAELGAF